MKYRIMETSDGYFYPQYKTRFWPFWSYFIEEGYNFVRVCRSTKESAETFLQKQNLYPIYHYYEVKK